MSAGLWVLAVSAIAGAIWLALNKERAPLVAAVPGLLAALPGVFLCGISKPVFKPIPSVFFQWAVVSACFLIPLRLLDSTYDANWDSAIAAVAWLCGAVASPWICFAIFINHEGDLFPEPALVTSIPIVSFVASGTFFFFLDFDFLHVVAVHLVVSAFGLRLNPPRAARIDWPPRQPGAPDVD